MASQLKITTLGGLTISLDGQPLTSLDSRKAAAILVYVACTGRSYPREVLAEMLWEGRTQAQALANLRVALTSLRQQFGPFLDITREAVGLSSDADLSLDVTEFEQLMSAGDPDKLQAALDLYQGDFLDGFYVDSDAFEDWARLERERLRYRAMEALDHSIAHSLAQLTYSAGIAHATQLLQMDPLREETHRQLMRLLALSGQRTAALEQYARCQALLDQEVGVAPAAETTALYEAIRSGIDIQEAVPAAETIVEPEGVLQNPYKGLRAFQEADAADFFGREDLTERLLDRLAESGPFSRFLAVVGPSGSGKSSVVKAGLLPALREGRLPGSDNWCIVEVVPGTHPYDELEIALTRLAGDSLLGLAEQLRRDTRGILRAARMAMPEDHAELLLIIDQFEEIFTLVANPAEAKFLLDSLYAAVAEPRSPLRVVITLRADFYDRPLMYPEFAEMVRQRTEAIIPMSNIELAEAVSGPADRVGVALEEGLVTTIVTDVTEQPGMLPMLQYALTELFDRRQDHTLTCEAYHTIGGALGALARRADAVCSSLTAQEQAAARQIFLRLVTLGEGTEDIRRRTLQEELEAVGGPETAAVLTAFGQSRMLTFDLDPSTGTPTVELAHESIIREWSRLHGWLEESRDDIRLQRLLNRATSEWATASADPSYLLRGARLTQFDEWASQTQISLTEAEHEFLDISRVEEERRQRRLRLIQNVALVTTLLVAVVMGALALIAFDREHQAALERDNAESAQAEAEREALVRQSIALAASAQEALLSDDTDLAITLAMEAYGIPDPPLEAERAVTNALLAPGTRRVFTGHEGPVTGVDISPDGRFAISSGGLELAHRGEMERYYADNPDDYTVRLWDLQTGAELHRFEGHTGPVWDVAFSPDGRTALSGSSDKTVILWDVDPESPSFGEILQRFDDAALSPTEIRSVAFGLDGQLAIAGTLGRVLVWDIFTGELVHRLIDNRDYDGRDPGGGVFDLNVSADGRRVFAAYEGSGDAILWDLETGEVLQDIYQARVDGETFAVALSRDGRLALTADSEKIEGSYSDHDFAVMILWDLETGREIRRFYHGWLNITGLAFLPDERLAVSVAGDQMLIVWDLKTGRILNRLSGHTDWINDVAITPDGSQAVTASSDGTLRLWDLRSGAEVLRLADQWVGAVDYSPDGQLIATGSILNNVAIWDATSGELIHDLRAHQGSVWSVKFTADANQLISASHDGTIIVWDVGTGQLVNRLVVPQGNASAELWDMDVSPGGQYLVVGGGVSPSGSVTSDGNPKPDFLRLWDLETGQLMRSFSTHLGSVATVAFSPDGRYVLSGSADNTMRLWDIATGEEVRRFTNHSGDIWNVEISADGRYALSGGEDRMLILWDLRTGEEIQRFPGHLYEITGEAFLPDGQHVLSTGSDGLMRLWNLESGQEVRRFTFPWRISHVAVDPTGQFALTGGDRMPIIWRIGDTTEEIVAWGQQNRYIRELTCEERVLFDVGPRCIEGQPLPTHTPFPTPLPIQTPTITPTLDLSLITATPTWTPLPSITPTPTTTSAPATTLEFDTPLRGTVPSGGRQAYTFEGTQGQAVTIGTGKFMVTPDFKLSLIDPSGAILEEGSLTQIGPITLPSTGTYLVTVESSLGSSSFTLLLIEE